MLLRCTSSLTHGRREQKVKARKQSDWSFVLMRGAERSVKQFNVSKRSLVATPVALLTVISSCFIGMQIKAASDINALKKEIQSYQAQYSSTVEQHEAESDAYAHSIEQLQTRLMEAYKQQEMIEAKLAELAKLEEQLEQFIKTYGEQTSLSLDRNIKTSNHYAKILSISNELEEGYRPELSAGTLDDAYSSGYEQQAGSNHRNVVPFPTNQPSRITQYVSSLLGSSSVPDNIQSENLNSTNKKDALPNDVTTNYTNHSIEIASSSVKQNTSFNEFSLLIDNFIEVMDYNLKKAKQIRQEVDAYPNYWPAKSKITTSGYGYRKDPFTGLTRFHAGIDIEGRKGDAIFSAGDGKVIEAGFEQSYGHYVIIEHSSQLKTLYAHLSQIEARAGDQVVKGEKIGLMGSSGRSTGTHLHFQVMLNDKPVSPTQYLVAKS